MKFFAPVAVACGLLLSCDSREDKSEPARPQIIQPVNNSVQDRGKAANLDKSPMDMIYYPPDYPVLKMSGKVKGLPVARVIYSRPLKDNRPIFGNIVKYGSYWRLGANESTEIEFFRDVTVTGKRVKKGRYIMYCIPFEDKWTIRLNNDLYTWGLKVHTSGDLYSLDIPVEKMGRSVEAFTMEFSNTEKGAQLLMAWDTVRAAMTFTY